MMCEWIITIFPSWTVRSRSGGKERSEAVEFLLPKNLAQKFANSDITHRTCR